MAVIRLRSSMAAVFIGSARVGIGKTAGEKGNESNRYNFFQHGCILREWVKDQFITLGIKLTLMFKFTNILGEQAFGSGFKPCQFVSIKSINIFLELLIAASFGSYVFRHSIIRRPIKTGAVSKSR